MRKIFITVFVLALCLMQAPASSAQMTITLNTFVWTFDGQPDYWQDIQDDIVAAQEMFDNNWEYYKEFYTGFDPILISQFNIHTEVGEPGYPLPSHFQNGCYNTDNWQQLPVDLDAHVNLYFFNCIYNAASGFGLRGIHIENGQTHWIIQEDFDEFAYEYTPAVQPQWDENILSHELGHAADFVYQHTVSGGSPDGLFDHKLFSQSTPDPAGNFMAIEDYTSAYEFLGAQITDPHRFHVYAANLTRIASEADVNGPSIGTQNCEWGGEYAAVTFRSKATSPALKLYWNLLINDDNDWNDFTVGNFNYWDEIQAGETLTFDAHVLSNGQLDLSLLTFITDYDSGTVPQAIFDDIYHGRKCTHKFTDDWVDGRDLNGDFLSDYGVYDTSDGKWLVNYMPGYPTTSWSHQWGGPGWEPIPGDFDGDGVMDVVAYEQSTGRWHAIGSAQGYQPYSTNTFDIYWGGPGWEPVLADWDGDGKADPTVYRPSDGVWSGKLSESYYIDSFYKAWGGPTWVPVPGDYDGDAVTDVAVYQDINGHWSIKTSSSGWNTTVNHFWGTPQYVPVQGDYDGDDQTDIGVYRPDNGSGLGEWSIKTSSSGYSSTIYKGWGGPGWEPAPGDHDGDGKLDFVVYKTGVGDWSGVTSSSGYTQSIYKFYGGPTKIPLFANW